jgi:hypothetical protein
MSKALQALTTTLALLAVVLLAVGVTGDVRNWWDDLGFVSNVLAGATGACFGIPFAVLILQRILKDEEKRREAGDLRRRLDRELRVVHTLAHGILHNFSRISAPAPSPFNLLGRKFWNLQRKVASIYETNGGVVIQAPDRMDADTRRKTNVEICRLASELEPDMLALQAATAEAWGNHTRAPLDAQANWTTLKARWESLVPELIAFADDTGVSIEPDTIVRLGAFLDPKFPPTKSICSFAHAEESCMKALAVVRKVAQIDTGHDEALMKLTDVVKKQLRLVSAVDTEMLRLRRFLSSVSEIRDLYLGEESVNFVN